MLSLLVWLLVVLLIMYVAYYILGLIALPEPVRIIILLVILIIILSQRFGMLGGFAL